MTTPLGQKSTPPAPTLQLLIIDDDEVDRMRVERMLRHSRAWNVEIDVALDKASGLVALGKKKYDCVLLDYNLPDGAGKDLLAEVQAASGESPPIIMQTVLDDDATALQALALGAQDYLVKGKFDERTLKRSIRYAMQRDQLIKERNNLSNQLRRALDTVKTLEGLLSTCSWCNRIQNEKGVWQRVEIYVEEHSNATFTHGMCPDCLKKYSEQFGLDSTSATP